MYDIARGIYLFLKLKNIFLLSFLIVRRDSNEMGMKKKEVKINNRYRYGRRYFAFFSARKKKNNKINGKS